MTCLVLHCVVLSSCSSLTSRARLLCVYWQTTHKVRLYFMLRMLCVIINRFKYKYIIIIYNIYNITQWKTFFTELSGENKKRWLTIWGSLERLTQPEISFNVSLFTVLMLLIRGCLVTISPDRHATKSSYLNLNHSETKQLSCGPEP